MLLLLRLITGSQVQTVAVLTRTVEEETGLDHQRAKTAKIAFVISSK